MKIPQTISQEFKLNLLIEKYFVFHVRILDALNDVEYNILRMMDRDIKFLSCHLKYYPDNEKKVNDMAVDWTKIEVKPDKEIKVIGSFLLDFREKVQNQTIEINKFQTENEKLQDQKQSLQDSLQSEQENSTSLVSKVQDLNNLISTKNEQIQQLTSETAKIKELEDQIMDLKSQVDGLLSEKQGLLGEKDDLTSKVAMLEKRAEFAEQQLNEAEQSASSFQTQLDDLKKQVEDLTSQLDEAKSYDSNKDSLIADLKKELREKEVILEAKDFEYFKNLRKQKAQQIDEASE